MDFNKALIFGEKIIDNKPVNIIYYLNLMVENSAGGEYNYNYDMNVLMGRKGKADNVLNPGSYITVILINPI